MNTILWTQNETPLTPSTLIIDGDCSEFKGNKLQNEAMKILSAISNWQTIREENSNLTIQFKKDEGYLISSCFEETDESGRPMVFKFYSDATDFSDAVDQMKNIMKQLNRTYNWSELNKDNVDRINEKIEKLKKKRTECLIVVAIVFLVTLVISFIVGSDKTATKNDETMDLKNDSVKKTNDYGINE